MSPLAPRVVHPYTKRVVRSAGTSTGRYIVIPERGPSVSAVSSRETPHNRLSAAVRAILVSVWRPNNPNVEMQSFSWSAESESKDSHTSVSDWKAVRMSDRLGFSLKLVLSDGVGRVCDVAVSGVLATDSCEASGADVGMLVMGLQTLANISRITSHPTMMVCDPVCRI